MGKYLIGIDQSTQGTKALLFDQEGNLIKRTDKAHRQIINEKGWVSHDPEEIYRNTLEAVRNLVQESGIPAGDVVGVGISNQRETSLAWDRSTGEPLGQAIVWQCARAVDICERVERAGQAEVVRSRTGINRLLIFRHPRLPGSLKMWKEQRRKQIQEISVMEQLTPGLFIN